MTDETLTRERILEAAEEVLRRFGLAKTTVVDVARALGVSHGSIYRHFPSKAALQDAVADRWLARKLMPLATIANEDGPATERLRRWLNLLRSRARKDVLDDPELFATHKELAGAARDVVRVHIDHLVEQIAHIICDGVAQGEFATNDPFVSARAVFAATTLFHDPAHVAVWSDPGIDAAFNGVWSLILVGLSPRTIAQA
ncbi:TetR family transcriptional regulator [Reticulibacter mediterranei]|uniref:TetR family transcriptional regulator n=1 Tax=Reticulibacter mediterranei TaxID=2778369 RepID=A0A8J3J2U1_9CHLR|nr:TetR/AcrR family transcriptional regulator [Reticulibacter mediterranei]GHO99741.1 TetR family transcriptional regulator [Reticulibacter mediterranei]